LGLPVGKYQSIVDPDREAGILRRDHRQGENISWPIDMIKKPAMMWRNMKL